MSEIRSSRSRCNRLELLFGTLERVAKRLFLVLVADRTERLVEMLYRMQTRDASHGHAFARRVALDRLRGLGRSTSALGAVGVQLHQHLDVLERRRELSADRLQRAGILAREAIRTPMLDDERADAVEPATDGHREKALVALFAGVREVLVRRVARRARLADRPSSLTAAPVIPSPSFSETRPTESASSPRLARSTSVPLGSSRR